MLYMNTNVLKTSKMYTNKLVGVTTRKKSKIFLRLLWFILLKDSLTTVLYIPCHNHQSRNQVIKNNCVCFLTFYTEQKKTAYCRFGVAKSNHKAIKYVNTPWALKKKRKGNSNFNYHKKEVSL